MPAFMDDETQNQDEQFSSDVQKEDGAESFADDLNEVQEACGAPEEGAEADAWDPSEEADEVATLKEEVEKLETALKDSDSSLKRLRADFENFRRRTAKEKEEISAVVLQEFLKDMLPIIDNFERALKTEAKDGESFRQGVEMIHSQFIDVLKKQGLEPIETEGQKFDPNFHQAVMRVENSDLEDESIAQELQKGYMAKGRVLRPSMVQVVANG